MLSWFTDTIFPLLRGALISEIYSGAIISEQNAMPPINRESTSSSKLGARAEPTDESKYKKATSMSAFRLPIASLIPPANSIAMSAPRVGELTTNPCCQSFKPNSASIKPFAPAITLASKPKIKPPSETIKV